MSTRRKNKNEKKTVEKSEEDLGTVSTYALELTRSELAHIRDLFSVKLPPEMSVTLSEALAESQERQLIETRLWMKIALIMDEAHVPYGNNSPDFTILPVGPAPVSVFPIEMSDTQLVKAVNAHRSRQRDEGDE